MGSCVSRDATSRGSVFNASPEYVDGQPELPLINAQTAVVVAVVVRDQQGTDVLDVFPMGGESGLGLLAADPSVEQEPDATRLDVDAVAVASGLQGDDIH